MEGWGKQDPYLVFKCNGRRWQSSCHEDAGLNPVWNELMDVIVSDSVEVATLECWDAGARKDTLIGETTIDVKEFAAMEKSTSHEIEITFEDKSVGWIHVISTYLRDSGESAKKDYEEKAKVFASEKARILAMLDQREQEFSAYRKAHI